ncbi:MAG: kinase-like domain-containing protein [Monoraphidium minutum]|nr:MAG: kinase-like domain-containing protein [Monoraphidium minutum]
MDTGEWTSHGQFLKKDKATTEIPNGLQQIKADDLIKVKELGRGCFGSVWLARWRGVEVALKEMLHQGHDTNPAEVFSEAEKLASLRHPCVMAFYGIVTSPDAYATMSEYICHGSLRGGLTKIRKKGISDKRLRAYITLQAAHGMEYLHINYMVHFDLKCDNLLCDLRDLNKPVVKIGDLGLSKLKKGSFVSGNMRGTLPWMAPELFPSVPAAVSGVHARKEVEDRVTEKVDVFSFGIVMWEIWTLGEQPYPNLSLQEIFAGVMTGTLRPSLPPGCDPAWASLMQDCWQGNPRLRPGFTEIIHRLEAMLQRWGAAAAAGGGGSSGAAAGAAGK